VNGKCNCTQVPGQNVSGAACNLTIIPPPTCQSLGSNCTDCISNANDNNLLCGWCTGPGKCLTDLQCIGQGGDIQTTCITQIPFVPPPCPDNCTNHGICVNRSDCAKLEKDPAAYNKAKCPLEICTVNCSTFNQTLVCACYPGHRGANCGAGYASALIAGLAGGAVAAIVVCGVLAAATFGGGSYFVATTLTQDDGGTLTANPLYQGDTSSGTSPVFQS